MNWLVVITYTHALRHVGPFPSKAAAEAWVVANESHLWHQYDFVPLEAPSLYVVPQRP